MEKGKSKWGSGIPQYTRHDLMTYKDMLNFSMGIIHEHEIVKNNYELIASSDDPGKIPNFVCKKDGKLIFIVVKVSLYPDNPRLSVEEKKNILNQAAKFKAESYFAPVGLGSIDPVRMEAGLALKNDGYYANYTGLQKIVFKRSSEWIRNALKEIKELDPEQMAGRQDQTVHFSIDLSMQTDFEKWKAELITPTFQEMLLTCIDRKGMTNQEFYQEALIDRKLFSAIKNNPDYQPKKETAVACCFGLHLGVHDAKKLLELAGYVLSMSIPWDRVVYYCLQNGITDIDVVNELLYEEGEKCIRV